MKNKTLLLLATLFMSSSALLAGEDKEKENEKATAKSVAETVTIPKISIDWFITNNQDELGWAVAHLYYQDQKIKEIEANEFGYFKLPLFNEGIYKVVLKREGYLEQEVILSFNAGVYEMTNVETEIEVDLMSNEELAKVEQAPKKQTAILIYNEKLQIFESSYYQQFRMLEQYTRLHKKIKKRKILPVNKYYSH